LLFIDHIIFLAHYLRWCLITVEGLESIWEFHSWHRFGGLLPNVGFFYWCA